MSETRKPRLCEVLGVEVNEPFTVCRPNDNQYDKNYDKYWIGENGRARAKVKDRDAAQDVCGPALCWLINHPESIVRLPRLTEPELAICKAVGAVWVSLDEGCSVVSLWSTKPDKHEDGFDGENWIGNMISDLFPSVHQGDCISWKYRILPD